MIERNVYGVDVDRFAVNIAMLRLWLSLIVDFEGRFEDIPALPNLDYKIARGDSLTAPNPQQTAPDLISHRARELADEISRYKGAFLRATGDEKRHIQQDVERGEAELRDLLAHSAIPADAIDWRIQFAEVFERGGFDIVLANPPYVRADAQFKHLKSDEELRQKEIDRWKNYRSTLLQSKIYQTLFEKWDLFLPFLERAYQMLCHNGQMIFIVSDAYNSAKYTRKSHEFFLHHARIERIDFCSDIPLFNASVSNTIVHFSSRRSFAELLDASIELIAARSPGAVPKVAIDRAKTYWDASSVGFVPWRLLTGVENKSIARSANYRKDRKPNDGLGLDREDREALSDEFDVDFVLALVNSAFVRSWLASKRRSKTHIYPDDWKGLPIPIVSLRDQQYLKELVAKILGLYDEHGYPLPPAAQSILIQLQQEIDHRVEALYKGAAVEGARANAAGEDDAATA